MRACVPSVVTVVASSQSVLFQCAHTCNSCNSCWMVAHKGMKVDNDIA